MSKLVLRHLLPFAVLLVAWTGCAARSSTLRLESFKDPYFPEDVRVELSDCAYRVDSGGDIHVTGRAGRGAVQEFLHVQIYWRPHPGKTPAESTMLDALLQYVVASDQGAAVYSGTGFAYPRRPGSDGELQVDIEAARLELATRGGDLPDVLGPTRVTGTLHARHAPGQAVALVREAQLATNR